MSSGFLFEMIVRVENSLIRASIEYLPVTCAEFSGSHVLQMHLLELEYFT